MEDLDIAGLVDRLSAALRAVAAEIGADGAIALELAVAVILVLAVIAGWLLHTLWVALGPRRGDLLARAHAAEAEAEGWRAEAARLSRLLENTKAPPPTDSLAEPSDAAPEQAAPVPSIENPPETGPTEVDTTLDGHDKPRPVG